MAITSVALKAIAPWKGNDQRIAALVGPLNRLMPEFGVTTPNRIAHFIAQAAHESDGFKTMEEYASGKGYEGRKDLGNVRKGDGTRYKGRGIFQLTGRANYKAYGVRIGVDLEGNPARASEPDLAVRVALEYWKAKGLNAWADRDDIQEITRRINGGQNGLADRKAYLVRAKKQFASAPKAPPASEPLLVEPAEELPSAPISPTPKAPWYESESLRNSGLGVLTSILGAANSPWGFATIAFIVLALACVGYGLYSRRKRLDETKPVLR